MFLNRKVPSYRHASSLASRAVWWVLAAALLAGPSAAASPSSRTRRHLQGSPDLYQQLSEKLQQPSDTTDLARSEGDPGQQRLMELLSVQGSMDGLLYPRPALENPDGDGDSADVTADQNSEDGTDLKPLADKRVFCNGFTGCGGRFRTQRRQDQLGKDKRVFCNSQGCFNGGRKRGMAKPMGGTGDGDGHKDAATFDMELWKLALRRLAEIKQDNLRTLSKRLFCNNYGGCQNLGKRRLPRLPLPSRAGRGASNFNIDSLPRLDFPANRDHHRQEKRWFASSVDGQFDAFNDALR